MSVANPHLFKQNDAVCVPLCSPTSVQVEMTDYCNLTCRHCYNYWRNDPASSRKTLNFQDIDAIVSRLKESKIPSVIITGGEPTLFQSELIYFIEELRRAEIAFSLNTNLIPADEKLLQMLKSRHAFLFVSFLTHDPELFHRITGAPVESHKRLIENIVKTRQLGIPITLNIVLSRYNIDTMEQTLGYVGKLGFKQAAIARTSINVCSPDEDNLLSSDELSIALDKCFALGKKFDVRLDLSTCFPLCLLLQTRLFPKTFGRPCSAGRTSLAIGANGGIRPCTHVEKEYGNIFTDGIQSSWEKMSSWRSSESLPVVCNACKLKDACTGGCRANSSGATYNQLDRLAIPENLVQHDKAVANYLGSRQREKAINNFSDEDLFTVNRNACERKELFGGFWFVMNDNRLTSMFLTENAAVFLRRSATAGFSTKDFLDAAIESGTDKTAALGLLDKLVAQKIIIKKERIY